MKKNMTTVEMDNETYFVVKCKEYDECIDCPANEDGCDGLPLLMKKKQTGWKCTYVGCSATCYHFEKTNIDTPPSECVHGGSCSVWVEYYGEEPE